MFENLSDKLDSAFRKLKGHGKLSEKNIEEGLKEVRMALLEADVHFRVAKKFIADVKERALGREVLASLTPGQQIIKIVNEELTELMGARHEDLNLSGPSPVALMLVGLQGSGKTTTAGKLAVYLRSKGRKPFLVPADVYRPAAIDQLKKLGSQLDIPVFASSADMDPVLICREAKTAAHRQGCDTLLLDTAGRLHVDEELMGELTRINNEVKPSDILLVADAMTGQDAVNIAQSFDEKLDIGGVILSKMDGDARGGAALSIKSITGKPIKFIGVGEKLNELAVSSGSAGFQHPGHGGRTHLNRKSPGRGGWKKSCRARKKTKEESIYPGGFSGSNGSDSQDGFPERYHENDPRDGQTEANEKFGRG